jgi:hypothetical protein
VAKYIASKLTIKRRSYLAALSLNEIKIQVTDYEKLCILFDDQNVYKLKASIDLKVIETYILAQ